MKGLFIPGITAKMFRDASVESVAELMTEGKIYDIDYQEPCEDAISRQAVLEQTYLWSKDEFLRVTNPFDYLRKRINSLPPVKPPEPTTVCSECGFDRDYNIRPRYYHKIRFCPICGAESEGKE